MSDSDIKPEDVFKDVLANLDRVGNACAAMASAVRSTALAIRSVDWETLKKAFPADESEPEPEPEPEPYPRATLSEIFDQICESGWVVSNLTDDDEPIKPTEVALPPGVYGAFVRVHSYATIETEFGTLDVTYHFNKKYPETAFIRQREYSETAFIRQGGGLSMGMPVHGLKLKIELLRKDKSGL